MPKVLKISDAASLALHATVLFAAKPEELHSAREIAEILKVSEAHLSKVLQRLTRAGLVKPTRGPKGGYQLTRPGNEIPLLEVYEAIEGPLLSSECLLGTPVCQGPCILGKLLSVVNSEVKNYLSGKNLSDVVGAYGVEENEEKNS